MEYAATETSQKDINKWSHVVTFTNVTCIVLDFIIFKLACDCFIAKWLSYYYLSQLDINLCTLYK